MANEKQYVCAMCGSDQGEPTPDGGMNFFWRTLPAGRAGPFCSMTCVRRLIVDDAGFTLVQIHRLDFWRHRAQDEDRTCAAILRVRSRRWDATEKEWVTELDLVPTEPS